MMCTADDGERNGSKSQVVLGLALRDDTYILFSIKFYRKLILNTCYREWRRDSEKKEETFSYISSVVTLFKSFPLTQNCYFGVPGHGAKSWGFESIWTHGGRRKVEKWQR